MTTDGNPNVRGALVGIAAAAIAIALAVGCLCRYQMRAQGLADSWAHDLAPVDLRVKTQTLTMQRAGFRQADLLPIYGTSELYCCGLPFNGPDFFWHEPTGFELYAVGEPVTGDLYFAQAFAALGGAIRGKKVVISDSPWFLNPGGIAPAPYDHTFSPEVALVFTYDAPISLPVREAIARRMLTYPETLQGRPLLSLGVRLLGHGTFRALAAYELLDPLGRLDAWIAQLYDARQTISALDTVQQKGWRAQVARQPHAVDWPAELALADRVTRSRADNNPFGVDNAVWTKCTDLEPTRQCASALAVYRAGRTNHGGAVYPYPAAWVRSSDTSAEWTDLALELQVLHELGAQPFAYMVPLHGTYADFTSLDAAARQTMYDHYAAVTADAGVPSTEFAAHDDDPYFVGSYGHFSPRGWVYADLTLDLFWHGRLGQIQQQLAAGGTVEQRLGDAPSYPPLAPPCAAAAAPGTTAPCPVPVRAANIGPASGPVPPGTPAGASTNHVGAPTPAARPTPTGLGTAAAPPTPRS